MSFLVVEKYDTLSKCCQYHPSSLQGSTTITVNTCDPHGYTPLHKAALLGQRKMVQLLLKHGAYIEARTFENQQSPLHLACQYNHKDVSVCMCVCV